MNKAILAGFTALIIGTGVARAQTPADIPPGLVAWWRAENSTQDTLGINHGTLRNNATYAAGKAGQGFSLNGANAYVEVPDAAALNFGTGDFTVECWVKFNSTGGEQVLVEKYSGAGWTFTKLGGNQLHLSMQGGTGHIISPSLSITTGVWHHFAARRSGGTGTLFMNGAVVHQAPVAGNVNSVNTLKFGTRSGGNFFLNGQMDEVALFNRALSDAEILAIYNAGTAGKNFSQPYFTSPDSLPGGGVGTPYTSPQFAAAVTPGPHTFTLTGGTLPAGLEFVNGVIFGTPVAAVSTDLTVTATSSLGQTATRTLQLQIANPLCPALIGQIAWWRGQNDALDAMSTNHGTLFNGATFAAGKVGQAFSFDGVDDYVQVPLTGIPVGNAARTVEFWMNTTALDVRSLFTYGAYSAGSAFYTAVVGSRLVIGQWGDKNPPGTKVVTDGVWHHAALTYDGAGTTRLYVDGTIDATRSGYSYNTTAGNFYIGGAVGAGPRLFAGLVDEFTVYDRALTSNEIAAIHAADSLGKCLPTSTNHPPAIDSIVNQTIDEGTTLSFTATATDPDAPQTFAFSFAPGAPAGASVSATGQFTWTPSEAQGPAIHPITVRVTDNGSPPLSAETQFTVTVNEVNRPPVLAPIPLQLANAGGNVQFTVSATDPDVPAQVLSFSLEPDAPPGVTIHPATGEFTWPVPVAFPSGTNRATIRVTDNGASSLSATQTVLLVVDKEGPRILSMTPSGLVSARVDYFDLLFDTPIVPVSFTAADILITPASSAAVSSVANVSGNTWRVTFSSFLPAGIYDVVIGPNITDFAGNPMNQDNDATNGEATGDAFIRQFDVRLPDLVLESLTAPGIGRFGDALEVVWTIRNQGNAAAAVNWSDRLYFSTDALPGNDTVLFTRSASSAVPLAVGASYTRTQAVVLPLGSSFAPGTFHLLAVADFDNALFEMTETNNLRASHPIAVSVPPLPDLAVAQIDLPANGNAGQALSVVWTVTNRNTASALGPWRDTVWLATNASGSNGQSLTTIGYAELLPGGGSLTRTGTVILPAGVVGKRYIALQTDSANEVFEGTNEGNNFTVRGQPIDILAPDLVVESVTAPAIARFGDTIEVARTVRNQGSGPALISWSDRLHLSTDALSGNDSILTTLGGTVVPLAAGAAYTRTQALVLPIGPTYLAGNYFILATADFDGRLLETNEANNTLASAPVQLSLPPLPDLAVSLVMAPSTASSGQPVQLAWAVTNRGPVAATNVWSEKVSFSNAVSGLQPLAVFTVASGLAGNSLVVRTQSVTLPLIGSGGDVLFFVEADSQREVFEGDESNNLGTATNGTSVPLLLKLQIATTHISENAASPILRATLTRNGSTAQPLTVLITNSDPTELSTPGTVVIAAGSALALFDVRVLPDGRVDGPQTVVLGASAAGYQDDNAQVTVLDSDLPRLALTLATNAVREGTVLAGSITRTLVTSNALTVLLQSSRAGQLTVPATVEIAAGESAASFVALAVADDLVEPATDYTISATAPGFESTAIPVTVPESDVPQVTVALANHTVSEGSGPQATSVTITRDPVTARQLVVDLTSDVPTAAAVPSRVAIPGGQASASVPVAAVDDAVVDGPQATVIRAFVLASSSPTRLVEGSPDTLTVTDDDGPALRLVVAQKIVGEGLSPATTATVSRNTATTNDLGVLLSSSRTNEAAVPASVTIPTGSSSATFSITSISDSTNDGSQTVILRASSPGYADAADTLLVTDTDLPDLTVSSVTIPVSGETETLVTMNYRVLNQGLADAPSNFLVRVFLSSDSAVGDDTSVGAYRFQATLPVGQYFEQSLPVRLPQSAGNYWVIVTVDPEQLVAEGLENNNTAVSRTPVGIGAGYAATVSTDVETTLAGTPILMRGRATNSLGAPVELKPVNIHIRVRGTERVITAITEAGGNFQIAWTPLAGEAGIYEIFATHPGVAQAPAQDTFSLLGMKASPSSASLQMVEQSSVVGTVRLENLSDQPLTGLTAAVINKPADLEVTLSLVNSTLPGLGTVSLGYAFTAETATAYGTVHLRVTTAEGVVADVYFGVSVEALRPRLVATPGALSGGMVRGRQRTVEFVVANNGGLPTGPLAISLPGVPWMHLVSTNPMPSLAPGETNLVTLLLAPAADLPLGPYTGSLALNAAQAGLNVSFHFRALSDAKGDLLVTAVDEYTFYAQGAPRVAGASVIVRDGISQATVATGVTDANGEFSAGQLMEGYYELEVTADRHTAYRKNLLLTPGQTNEVQAFLARQTVQYVWTVEPVEIEDRYDIRIDTVFETAVPLPVVTVEPALVDLAKITGDAAQIEFKISNHGLIDAREFRFTFDSHPQWEIKPLLTDLGVLPAQSTLTVPVTLRRLPTAGGFQPASTGSGQGSCTISGGGCWTLPCGVVTNSYCAQVTAINPRSDCQPPPPSSGEAAPAPPSAPPPGGNALGGTGSADGVSVPIVSGPSTIAPPTCDCFIPFGLEASGSIKADALANRLKASFTARFPGWTVKDFKITLSANGRLGTCCKEGKIGREITGTASANVSFTLQAGPNVELRTQTVPGWDSVSYSGNGLLGVEVKVAGSVELHLEGECKEEAHVCGSGSLSVQAFAGAQISGNVSATKDGVTFSGAVNGQLGMQGSITVTASGCDGNYTLTTCGRVTSLAHLNGTLRAGDMMESFSMSADSVVADAGCAPAGGFAAAGMPDPGNNVEVFDAREFLNSDEELRRLLNITNRAPTAVCTQVKIRLDQQAVVSRDAFKATLEIINSTATPLTSVGVDVVVKDSSGQDRTSLFGVREPILAGLTAVEGAGRVEGSATGRASWLIIPGQDAAPEAATVYSVSGTLRYEHDGLQITVPLAAVSITVLPNPRLHVKYFHQRDVFSDDPFTEVIEPSVPFNLALMVENKGRGSTRNFRITSAQPEIVDNERGLLADFRIIATEVAGQNLSPSLTVNLGNIDPGHRAIGRWLLTSTIHGQFTDYKATFEHIDGLGNPKLSLIEDLAIKEMTHLVQAAGGLEDGQPDFLVDEDRDARALPDTLYLSDGSTNLVRVIEQSSVTNLPSPTNVLRRLTASMPAGWAYMRVPEPSDGQLRLERVQRSDGLEIPLGTNVWTTDRTFVGMGRRPVRENILHLLDHDSPGSYTLHYTAPPPPDTNAPSSAVATLSDNSYPQISLSWSGADGADGSGLAFFDVYVSTNGGPFAVWLPRTTQRGAIYSGEPGRRYSFFTVATDRAGNREATPTAPDAETEVSLFNRPPVLLLPGTVVVDEGQTVTITNATSDPDVPANLLTFSLGPGAPSGAIINPVTGLVTWSTGEAHGPGTNRFTVRVTDNGQPGLTATGTLTVIVNEVNAPPTLGTLTNRVVNERQLLTFRVPATDRDLPEQPLTYSLGAGAPFGAVIEPLTGVFTWTPSETNGGKTNLILVVVRDTGTPSLSTTQSFAVAVRDVLPDFTVRIGTTNLLAGGSGTVPIEVGSGLELKTIALNVDLSAPGLRNLAIQPVAPEVQSATIQPTSSNRFLVTLETKAGQSLLGSVTPVLLHFGAPSNTASAVVSLQLSGVEASTVSGFRLLNGRAAGGRVFLIGEQPLMDAMPAVNGARMLVLYGHPGKAYEVQSATNLNTPRQWQPVRELELGGHFATWTDLAGVPAQIYYRAVQLASPAALRIGDLSLLADGRLRFQFPGMVGRTYAIETSTNLIQWHAIGTNVAPVNFDAPQDPAPYRFFRMNFIP